MPAPPPATPKGFQEEFLDFLNKYGVIGLAIAFIIGGAAGRLVSALVDDILMPIITFFIPGG
ncbi:MAG: large conductance mechanosensitive channel protein MscL, partial [Candidatus Thorarchaeota archaeon]|nr:large conductance mechanosensitive channel protein MscL [Candidatus Thorarchaeota archaeon]